jgi:hypothetical protein
MTSISSFIQHIYTSAPSNKFDWRCLVALRKLSAEHFPARHGANGAQKRRTTADDRVNLRVQALYTHTGLNAKKVFWIHFIQAWRNGRSAQIIPKTWTKGSAKCVNVFRQLRGAFPSLCPPRSRSKRLVWSCSVSLHMRWFSRPSTRRRQGRRLWLPPVSSITPAEHSLWLLLRLCAITSSSVLST